MGTLPELAIEVARRYIGTHEIGTTNTGPQVNQFCAFVGYPNGGIPWCAAFVSFCIQQAAKELGLTPTMHFSASAFALYDKNPSLQHSTPERGRLVVWDHGHGAGHVALVTGVESDGFWAVSGNTSAAKGTPDQERNGGCVAEKRYTLPDPAIKGYVEIA